VQHHTRATFDAAELAVVLSYYDLGVIESVTELTRGSRRSPKVGLVAERGKFLLKRRSIERAHPDRVRFVHRVQHHLVQSGFPLAPLVPTRDNQRTWVQLREHIYELFRFMPGQAYARTVDESRDAGASLARLHWATTPFASSHAATQLGPDYHDAPGVRTGLGAIGATLNAHDSFSGHESELLFLTQYLLEAYNRAADAVNRLPFSSWPRRLIHSDWHPGNLLFRNGAVLAVIDYDSMRFSRRVVDVANGALHFSIMAGEDPVDWPDHLDMDRYRAFLEGYDQYVPTVEARLAFGAAGGHYIEGHGSSSPPVPVAESAVVAAAQTQPLSTAETAGLMVDQPSSETHDAAPVGGSAIHVARPINLVGPLTLDERRCLPHLMVEAFIAECVTPIAATGSVGRWSGFRVMQMIRRKLDWIGSHIDSLVSG